MNRIFRSRNSIVNVLTFYAIILIALALMVAGIATFFVSYNTQQSEVLRGLEKTTQQATSGISSHLNLALNSLDVFANTQNLTSKEPAEQNAALTTLLAQQRKLFSELAFLDSSGQETARVSNFRIYQPSELTNQANSPEFLQALEHDTYIGPIRISEQSNVPVTTVSIPVTLTNGDFGGVLVAEVTLKEMWDIVSQIEFGKSGYLYVVDENGQLRASDDLTEAYNLFGQDVTHIPEVQRFAAGIPWDVEQDHIYTGLKDIDVIGSYAPVEGADWGVVAELPTDEAFSGLQSMLITLIAVFIGVAIIAAVISPLLLRRIRIDLSNLQSGAEALSKGDFSHQIEINRQDELGTLAGSFNNMANQLQELIGSLEQQVTERTQALETSAEVSRRLSTILNPEQLVVEVVEQLRTAFGFYHAHIYLYDERKQHLLMAGGTGDAGRVMLAQGHQIEPGRGLVGRAAIDNQIILIPDVTQAEGWLPNPLLPETKAEVAVPITAGAEVIGVLDVQHNITSGLTEENASLIQSIANQVGIAIQNAQAYTRTQRQAVREAQITAINQRIQSAATIDDVLQIAISELGQTLETQQASVELQVSARPNSRQNQNNL